MKLFAEGKKSPTSQHLRRYLVPAAPAAQPP